MQNRDAPIHISKSPFGRLVQIDGGLGYGGREVLEKKCNEKAIVYVKKIQKDFLRGGGTFENKPYLVDLFNVACKKRKRGRHS